MIISEVNAVLNLLEKAYNFAGLLKDGWYKSSAELVTFPYKVENLTWKHKEWIRVLRKFGQSDDEVLTAFVEEAEKILTEEQKHISKLKKSKFERWRQRAFPGRLTEILEAMEMCVNGGLELLKSRDEMVGLLERDENRIEIPLPFQHDHKYVPIARSVAEVQTAVESAEGSRVVIVHGDGGMGKTSLVKYIALSYQNMRRERPQAEGSASQLFSDGVFFLRCGRGASIRVKELERELLESLGFRSEATADNILEELEGDYQTKPSHRHRSLRFKLARRNSLIILDDVWEREVLEGLLMPGEGVTYLITSRRRDIWPDLDARRILLEKPTLEDARNILAMYTELPENIEEIVDSIINGVGFHPLMLANIGLAMGATGESNPDEWKRMAKEWRDELHQRDFKYHPILHGQSYQLSMDDTMNLMMESLEEGERSLLLLMSLLENEQLPEVIVKFFRKCMEPGEVYFDYRRYKNQLHDKSLLEVYSPHVQGCGSSNPDTEDSQTCLAIHKLRALSIRKNYSEEIRSMAIRALDRANHTNDYSANSWMIGRGLWGSITATSDVVRSLVTRFSRATNTGNSMISGTGGCREGNNSGCGVLTAIMAAMYVDKTLWDAAELNTHSLLRVAYRDVSIIPRSVHADVNVIGLIETARKKKIYIRGLVGLLNRDGEEGWKREAHYCASKIIVRFICRQELDDISVAQLVQLHQHTTVVICNTLRDILRDGYWASKFVDHNITFSSVHSETTKALFDLLYKDTTPINILKSVANILFGDSSFGGGILTYEDDDTIVKVLVKVLAEDSSETWQGTIIGEMLYATTRTIIVMGKIPDLRKRVVRQLFAIDKEILNCTGIDRILNQILTLSGMQNFVVEVIETPGALDMLWILVGSPLSKQRGEWEALGILENLTSSSGGDKEIFLRNQKGLINLLNILTSNQAGRDLKELLTNSSEGFPPLWNGRNIFDLTPALAVLRNLALTKEVRKVICHLCPEVSERLHILERLVVEYADSLRDSGFQWEAYDFIVRVSETRTIFDSRFLNIGITDYSPPISPKVFTHVLRGTFDGCMTMEMFKEALDIARNIPLDIYDWNLKCGIIFAKAMVKDYKGALVDANDQLLEYQLQRGYKSEHCGFAHGRRGILIRLLGGDLAQAMADLDVSLSLIRSRFSEHPSLDNLYSIYHLLKQRGFVKHLMGDDTGAKEDAHSAEELQLRSLVWNRSMSGGPRYDLRILQLPADYST